MSYTSIMMMITTVTLMVIMAVMGQSDGAWCVLYIDDDDDDDGDVDNGCVVVTAMEQG